jgi:tRNA-dihydrouridine synthase B
LEYKKRYGVDGIMIGRAAIGYPWIFNEIKHFIQTGEHLSPPTIEQRVKVIRQHLRHSVEWKGLIPGINEMRRHYTNYLKGLPNIKEYRLKLVTTHSVEEIDEVLKEIAEVYSGHLFERRKVEMEAMAYSCG